MRRLTQFGPLLGAIALAIILAACGKDDASSNNTASKADEPGPRSKLVPTPKRAGSRAGDRNRDRGPTADEQVDDEPAERDQARDEDADKAARIADRRADRSGKLAGFDTNGDGKLDDDERASMMKGRVSNMLEQIDSDGDGKISKQEAEAAPRRAMRMVRDFEAADADSDGFISEAELSEAMGSFGRRGGGSRGDGAR